jgi:uncharacterized phage protein gp47/JayE
MGYLDLTTTFIDEESLQQLAEYSNVNFLSPGAKARILLDIVNDKLSIQARQFDLNTGKAFIRNADGILLDYIGEIFGLQRRVPVRSQVTAAENNFYLYTLEADFGSINLGADINIPRGALRVYNTEDRDAETITYVNTEDVFLPAGETRVYFSAEALDTGSNANVGANSLVFHNYNGYADSINRSLLVSNGSSITYGEEEESDENYRFRIQQQAISGEAANFSALRLALLSIPGVSDVLRIRYPRGIGTSDWLIKAVTPEVPQSLIDTCQTVIDETQAEGTENLAKAPVTIGMELGFSVTYRSVLDDNSKTQIKNEIIRNITNYVNNLAIGEKPIIDQIKKTILNTDNRIESLGDPDSSADFRRVNIYKRSATSDSVVRRAIIGDYNTKSNERVIVEPSVATPIAITDNN